MSSDGSGSQDTDGADNLGAAGGVKRTHDGETTAMSGAQKVQRGATTATPAASATSARDGQGKHHPFQTASQHQEHLHSLQHVNVQHQRQSPPDQYVSLTWQQQQQQQQQVQVQQQQQQQQHYSQMQYQIQQQQQYHHHWLLQQQQAQLQHQQEQTNAPSPVPPAAPSEVQAPSQNNGDTGATGATTESSAVTKESDEAAGGDGASNHNPVTAVSNSQTVSAAAPGPDETPNDDRYIRMNLVYTAMVLDAILEKLKETRASSFTGPKWYWRTKAIDYTRDQKPLFERVGVVGAAAGGRKEEVRLQQLQQGDLPDIEHRKNVPHYG